MSDTIIRCVIGANYGDEGKGTVVAHYTKNAVGKVLNVLTNGGAQRAHNITVGGISYKNQHFGSGTYFGADNYFSKDFIINPIIFVDELISKSTMFGMNVKLYRHTQCRWSTPYDMMTNQIIQTELKTGTCGIGIWETVLRYDNIANIPLDEFVTMPYMFQKQYINIIKSYFEKRLGPHLKFSEYKNLWDDENILNNFISDCNTVVNATIPCDDISTIRDDYSEIILENGQGLLLSSNSKDDGMTTPSNTGAADAIHMFGDDIKLHYVTRSYLTKHGGYVIDNECDRKLISSYIEEDATNPYNKWQGEFRYAPLDIDELKSRIEKDASSYDFTLELTHCDEMDLSKECESKFNVVNIYDTPEIF